MATDKQVKGAVLGFLIGDAWGLSYAEQGVPLGPLPMIGSNRFPHGTYTDAGAMLLTTIASLNENGSVDLSDLMSRLHDWYLASYLTSAKSHDGEDYVETKLNVIQSIKNFDTGMPPDRCAVIDELSYNNAGLLRILPVALLDAHKHLDVIIRDAHLVTRLTNKVPRAEVVSAVFALLVSNIFLDRSEKVFDVLADYYKEHGLEAHADELTAFRQWKEGNAPSGTNDARDCFWSAWTAYSSNQDAFEAAIVQSIRLGNNCNETAALAGALAGLRLGSDNIPDDYLAAMRIGNQALDEITKFIKTVKRLQT